MHVGDTIAVRVLNHPDISAPQTLVDAQGNIVVPLAGSLHVAGMTLTAIGTAIQTALATYIKFPAVDVLMEKPGTAIFVAGGPGGTLKFVEGETLSSALADLPKVDGVDVVRSRVDLRRVNLIRDGATLGTYDIVALSAHGQPGPALVPGDTIVLSNKPISVHVRGDVVEPGTVF
ncbi:MAG: polysaccharide biosynthesis/export family protein, partial [Vulcanimicrobiaceae bacterium]